QHRATGERGGRADAVGQGAGDLVAHARQAQRQAALTHLLARILKLAGGTAHAPYVSALAPARAARAIRIQSVLRPPGGLPRRRIRPRRRARARGWPGTGPPASVPRPAAG